MDSEGQLYCFCVGIFFGGPGRVGPMAIVSDLRARFIFLGEKEENFQRLQVNQTKGQGKHE